MERLFFQEVAADTGTVPLRNSRISNTKSTNPAKQIFTTLLGALVVIALIGIITTPFILIGKITYNTPAVEGAITSLHSTLSGQEKPADNISASGVYREDGINVLSAGVSYAGSSN